MSEALTRRTASPRRLLGPALVAVLTTDLVGGLLDVAAGRSSLTSAWSSSATLCAPWPMIAFQVVTGLLVLRSRGVLGRVAAVLLASACVVSVLSGFFDGQLGRADLSTGASGFQLWLLAATGLLGVAAGSAAVTRRRRAGQNPKRSRNPDSHAATGTRPHS